MYSMKSIIIYGDTIENGNAEDRIGFEEYLSVQQWWNLVEKDYQNNYQSNKYEDDIKGKSRFDSFTELMNILGPTLSNIRIKCTIDNRSIVTEIENLEPETAAVILNCLNDDLTSETLQNCVQQLVFDSPIRAKVFTVGLKRNSYFIPYTQILSTTHVTIFKLSSSSSQSLLDSERLYPMCKKISSCLLKCRDDVWPIDSKFRVMIFPLAANCTPVKLPEIYGDTPAEEIHHWLTGIQNAFSKNEYFSRFLVDNSLKAPVDSRDSFLILFSFDRQTDGLAHEQTIKCLNQFGIKVEEAKHIAVDPLSCQLRMQWDNDINNQFPGHTVLTPKLFSVVRSDGSHLHSLQPWRAKRLQYLRAKYVEWYYSGRDQSLECGKFVYFLGEGDPPRKFFNTAEEAEEVACCDSLLGYPAVFLVEKIGEPLEDITEAPQPDLSQIFIFSCPRS